MAKAKAVRLATCAAAAALCLLGRPGVARAQTASPQVNQGPMRVERVESGFAIVPEVKFTEVNHRDAWLAGVYGGWILDRTFLVGGGGYWLTNRSSSFRMAYGGPVVQWFVGSDKPVGFSARSLIGFGSATLPGTVCCYPPYVGPYGNGRGYPVDYPIAPYPIGYYQWFGIFEPQANVAVRLSRQLRLSGGFGYRVIWGAYSSNNQLRGPSGSVGVEIGNWAARRSP